MYLGGAGGSGVVVARLPDGTWSPPSAFSVRSGSVGLVYGVDVYDCICILNTSAAVAAYTKSEMSLGGAASLAAGTTSTPSQGKDKETKPVLVYTKSKGFYGGVTVDGTIISQRTDANEMFYGGKVTSEMVLRGDVVGREGVGMWPGGAKKLMEMLKVAEGKEADVKVLQEISSEPTAGDLKA